MPNRLSQTKNHTNTNARAVLTVLDATSRTVYYRMYCKTVIAVKGISYLPAVSKFAKGYTPWNKGMVTDPVQRFWSKVNKTESCWEWIASKASGGYGMFAINHDKLVRAHVFAYQTMVGEIPEGLVLDHLCRNRICVNPAHLEPVTRRENVLRGETLPAKNLQKTHCPNGHLLAGENLSPAHLKRGGRTCRICLNQREMGYRQKRKGV